MSADAGSGAHDPRSDVLEAGRRVVIRYAIERESSPHGEGMTDALGVITALDARTVSVMTRRGEVDVPRERIIAAKRVPPPPRRRPSGPPAEWRGRD